MATPPLSDDVIEQSAQTLADYGGNQSRAADALGISRSALQDRIKMAARRGISPHHDKTGTTPPGFSLKGKSILYGADGQVRAQWIKTSQEQEDRAQALMGAVEAMCQGYKKKPAKAPKRSNEDLLTVYPMGDPHIGMYAWAEETGTDFDCDIAERQLCEAVDNLVSLAPASKVGIILNLGDFFHADNTTNRTMGSGHPLDVDTRWGRVLDIGARAMERCISAALRKHEKVIVRNNIGNHDEHTSQALALAMHLLFREEPRVTIDRSPSHFWYYLHGKSLIGSTHGDMTKPEKLPQIMAADRPEDWGKAEHRCWYIGHVHHKSVTDAPGCHVRSFRTLAAKDAWTAMMGYRSGRDMHAIIHHNLYGEIQEHRVDVSMLT